MSRRTLPPDDGFGVGRRIAVHPERFFGGVYPFFFVLPEFFPLFSNVDLCLVLVSGLGGKSPSVDALQDLQPVEGNPRVLLLVGMGPRDVAGVGSPRKALAKEGFLQRHRGVVKVEDPQSR